MRLYQFCNISGSRFLPCATHLSWPRGQAHIVVGTELKSIVRMRIRSPDGDEQFNYHETSLQNARIDFLFSVFTAVFILQYRAIIALISLISFHMKICRCCI